MNNSTIDNLYRVLSDLDGIEPAQCRENMLDYDEFMNEIQHKIFIQTFIVQYRNAEKCYMKENRYSEMKSLKNVINLMDTDEITDQEFKEKGLKDYVTRTVLTTDKIVARLKELEQRVMGLD